MLCNLQRIGGPALTVLDEGCHRRSSTRASSTDCRAVPAGDALVEGGGKPQRCPVVPSRQAIVEGSSLAFDVRQATVDLHRRHPRRGVASATSAMRRTRSRRSGAVEAGGET